VQAAGSSINLTGGISMRKLICVATLLGSSLLPMIPPAEAQQVVVKRPGHTLVFRNRRAARRYFRRSRWTPRHHAWRGGRWVYW
jgi:hypothetical protein